MNTRSEQTFKHLARVWTKAGQSPNLQTRCRHTHRGKRDTVGGGKGRLRERCTRKHTHFTEREREREREREEREREREVTAASSLYQIYYYFESFGRKHLCTKAALEFTTQKHTHTTHTVNKRLQPCLLHRQTSVRYV